jgi:selenide,water dikinase
MRPLKSVFAGVTSANLLVGLDNPDDAAVYKLSEGAAVIFTTDFFTPIVDDPYDYGAIAAANAMSDIYAMGGEVVLALNIACFPADLPMEICREILRGGAEKVREAGGVIAGGHTVEDPEPKYGMAVMGLIHPDRVASKAGARPGDVLVLTKPLGVGIVTTAFKSDVAEPRSLEEAVASMVRLNRDAAHAMVLGPNHAATDITGFGLLGHAWEMVREGGVRFRFHFDALPFVYGAKDLADAWLFPGGANKNEAAYRPHVDFASSISEEMRMLIFTPETSGGLLIALPAGEVSRFQARCANRQQPCWVVGEVLEGGSGIEVM